MPNRIIPRRSFTPNSVPLPATDISAAGELLINWADKVAYSKDSSGNLITVPLGGSAGGGSGSGSASLVYAATPAGFPATGSADALYIATDTQRIFRWATNVYVECGPVGGGGTDLSPLFLPPAPTSVFSIASSTSASVAWTAPSATHIPPITDYVVQYQPSGGSWTTFADGTSVSTSATVTGLSSGTSYSFRVAAVNGVGTGAYGTATAVQSYAVSSASSNRNSYSSSGTADKAADGDPSTYFQSSEDNAFPVYLTYDLGSAKTVSLYRLQGASGGGYNDPSAWTLQGSSDNSTWVTLDARTWPNSLYGGPYSFPVASPTAYRYYRLAITALNAGGNAALASFDVFGA